MSLFQSSYCTCRNTWYTSSFYSKTSHTKVNCKYIVKMLIKVTRTLHKLIGLLNMYCFMLVSHREKINSLYSVAIPVNISSVA